MTRYQVEVFVGEDAVRWYGVEATSEESALEVALEHVRDLVGGEVGPCEDEFDDLDFDDVLVEKGDS